MKVVPAIAAVLAGYAVYSCGKSEPIKPPGTVQMIAAPKAEPQLPPLMTNAWQPVHMPETVTDFSGKGASIRVITIEATPGKSPPLKFDPPKKEKGK